MRRLEIRDCNISDLSGLAELTQLEWLVLVNNQISDITPLANLKRLEHLNLDANVIKDVSPLAQLTKLEVLYLENNIISDVSPLAGLTNLERLDLRNNAISDFSPLDGLPEKTIIRWQGNSSVLRQGGPKITGPWLWVVLPGEGFHSGKDLLAQAKGKNVLLVAIFDYQGGWAGAAHFGFAPDAEYTVLPPGDRFSFSTVATQVKVGGTFTVQLKAENISDLAGWQTNIKFDPAVLKVNNVREGSFLKQDGGRTHFLKGTIDNTEGRITDVGAARISEGGASGEGTLLSVTFTAKANGETRLSLRKFQAGSSAGETIFSRPPEIIMTVGDPSSLDVSDGPFSLSTDVTPVRLGGTFNLLLKAEEVTNLAGWQADIAFDSEVLEAVAVNEGDFLKADGGSTFF